MTVQEKVDGSQISFAKLDGKLYARSKGQMLVDGAPSGEGLVCDGMFQLGVDAIGERFSFMPEGVVYRGEYLAKPKHNTLVYDRVPQGHIAIFDIQVDGAWVTDERYRSNLAECVRFEAVPTFFTGEVGSRAHLELLELLETTSFLGGPNVEGIVIKAHDKLTQFGDPMFAKYVSEAFKEQHSTSWKNRNPGNKDVVTNLISMYRTEARWEKAIQHARDAGALENDPRDIGRLMKELAEDFIAECKDEVCEYLWKHTGKNVVRGIQGGFPEFYKARLMESAFANEPELNDMPSEVAA